MLFLTGASGLVGSHVARVAARRGIHVVAVVGRSTRAVEGARSTLSLDLADPGAVQRAVLDLFPDAIVNAAALSETSACDADPVLSEKLNVALPAALAQLAHHFGARFIHLSSEQVFDGTRPPYRADDPVCPVNLYGRHKAESERLVAKFATAESVTLRLPLLGGNSPGGCRSMHERLFATWAEGRRAALFRDEIRQVCSAENVAEVIVELCERDDCRGTHHWAGAEPLSRAEMGRRVAAHFNLPAADLIDEIARNDVPFGAGRQPDLSMDCRELAGRLKTRQQTFAQLLEQCLVPAPFRDWYHTTAPDTR